MPKRTIRATLLAGVSLATLLSWHTAADSPADASVRVEPASAEANWPQFRGPGGLGIANDTEVPTSWSETENVVWKAPIDGRGHSSPIVWGDTIFLTTAIEGDVIPDATAPTHFIGGEEFKHPQAMGSDRSHKLEVMAIDRTSGEIMWSDVAYEGRVYDDRHQNGSYASATAATDGELVFFYFGSEGIYAYDFDGNRVWGTDLGDFSYFGVGLGASPLLWQDILILLVDEGEGENSFVVGLEKRTGEEVWRTPRTVDASWATPLLFRDNAGVDQLFTLGMQFLISYDPATGAELWRLDGLRNNAVHSPIWDGELIHVSSGYPRTLIQAIRPTHGPDGAGAEVDWEYRKGAAYVSSNVVYEGKLYVTNDKGIITCFDAATGELVYEGGRIPVPSSMLMSSLLVVDGKIMVSTPEGDTFLIETGAEFAVVSHNSIDEPIWATPAIVDGTIYLRGQQHLYAIRSADGSP